MIISFSRWTLLHRVSSKCNIFSTDTNTIEFLPLYRIPNHHHAFRITLPTHLLKISFYITHTNTLYSLTDRILDYLTFLIFRWWDDCVSDEFERMWTLISPTFWRVIFFCRTFSRKF